MQIHTERLVLRDFLQEDLHAIHEYASDPLVVKYMTFGPNTLEDTQNFLNRAMGKQGADPRTDYELAVVMKSEGRLIGGCRLNKVSEIEAHLGYIVNRSYWGKGYATEAARSMVEFAFGELGLHRVYADVHPDNAGSVRVLEKLGMTLEGRRRENMMIHGEYQDHLLYSILEREWRASC